MEGKEGKANQQGGPIWNWFRENRNSIEALHYRLGAFGDAENKAED